MLHHHVRLDPLNRLHFFLPITISFPNCPTIKTFAFVDSGSCASHIGDAFSKQHSLPRSAKPVPIPIFTIDNQPLVSGLLTHDMITQLKVHDHTKTIWLGIVSMPYPILLGLDWLRQHNPAIDWMRSQLVLSCCGSNHNFPISAFSKGYGLASPSVSNHIKISSLGLGFCLNNPPPISKYSLPNLLPFQPAKPETFASEIFANYSRTSSILHPVFPNGPSRQELKAIWLSLLTPPLPVYGPNKPIDIAHISLTCFLKYSKNQHCYCIWYTTNQDLDICINALSTNTMTPNTPPSNQPPPSPPPEPPPISIPPWQCCRSWWGSPETSPLKVSWLHWCLFTHRSQEITQTSTKWYQYRNWGWQTSSIWPHLFVISWWKKSPQWVYSRKPCQRLHLTLHFISFFTHPFH